MKQFTPAQLELLKEIKNMLVMNPIGYNCIKEFENSDITFEQFLIRLSGYLLRENNRLLLQNLDLMYKQVFPVLYVPKQDETVTQKKLCMYCNHFIHTDECGVETGIAGYGMLCACKKS